MEGKGSEERREGNYKELKSKNPCQLQLLGWIPKMCDFWEKKKNAKPRKTNAAWLHFYVRVLEVSLLEAVSGMWLPEAGRWEKLIHTGQSLSIFSGSRWILFTLSCVCLSTLSCVSQSSPSCVRQSTPSCVHQLIQSCVRQLKLSWVREPWWDSSTKWVFSPPCNTKETKWGDEYWPALLW